MIFFAIVTAIQLGTNSNILSDTAKLENRAAYPSVIVAEILNDIVTSGVHLDLTAYRTSPNTATIASTGSLFDKEPLARVNFTRSFTELGWNVAELRLSETTSTSMYLAGFIEALVTAEEIGTWYTANVATLCKTKRSLVQGRLDQFVKDVLEKSKEETCPEWMPSFEDMSKRFWAQLEGMVDGYNYVALRRARTVTTEQVQGIQVPQEALLPGMALIEFMCMQLEAQLSEFPDRCSAVVALHQDQVMVAHATWERPSEAMPKLFRMIHVAGGKHPVNMQLSTYPGLIWSSDDWIVRSDGLVMLETSLMLHKSEGTPRIPEFLKTMVAATLADSPSSFGRLMTQCDYNAFDVSNAEWLAVNLRTKELVTVRDGQFTDTTKQLITRKMVGSFNGERSGVRLAELNKVDEFKNVDDLWTFFAKNQVLSPAGAADLKMTATSITGSLVRAGPSPAAGEAGAYDQYEKLSNIYSKKFDWRTAPRVRMREGCVEIDTVIEN